MLKKNNNLILKSIYKNVTKNEIMLERVGYRKINLATS